MTGFGCGLVGSVGVGVTTVGGSASADSAFGPLQSTGVRGFVNGDNRVVMTDVFVVGADGSKVRNLMPGGGGASRLGRRMGVGWLSWDGRACGSRTATGRVSGCWRGSRPPVWGERIGARSAGAISRLAGSHPNVIGFARQPSREIGYTWEGRRLAPAFVFLWASRVFVRDCACHRRVRCSGVPAGAFVGDVVGAVEAAECFAAALAGLFAFEVGACGRVDSRTIHY